MTDDDVRGAFRGINDWPGKLPLRPQQISCVMTRVRTCTTAVTA
jgi:hypothetical protein